MTSRFIRAVLVCIVAFPSCAGRGEAPAEDRVPQGIAGTVRFHEGDFMPGPETRARGSMTPVRRELRIHHAAGQDSVVPAGEGGFFSRVLTPLAGTAVSDDSGRFAISLPPGRYSVFVVEDSLLYANLFDGRGYVFPVTVLPDSVAHVRVDITYRATY